MAWAVDVWGIGSKEAIKGGNVSLVTEGVAVACAGTTAGDAGAGVDVFSAWYRFFNEELVVAESLKLSEVVTGPIAGELLAEEELVLRDPGRAFVPAAVVEAFFLDLALCGLTDPSAEVEGEFLE